MGYDIGPKIGVDGEAEFRAQLNQITSIVKTLGTEMQVVASRFDKQQDSEEALTAKNKVLTKEIEEQVGAFKAVFAEISRKIWRSRFQNLEMAADG